MPLKSLYFIALFSLLCSLRAGAQNINGEVDDMEDRGSLSGVEIENIYTGLTVLTDTNGKFLIAAAKGQLLEFKKLGYKSVRVRIPDGYMPSYFKIIIKKAPAEVAPYDLLAQHTYHSDSIYFHELYAHELNFPKLSGIDAIQHPFSAMSKKNLEIWAFQDDYKENEKQKYIDYVFNPQLVARITGLSGDNLKNYMRRYRPTYEQLRTMGEYAYYSYIKRTAKRYTEIMNLPNRNSQ
jgi:hypothetical protein